MRDLCCVDVVPRNLSDVLWEAIHKGQILSLYQGLGTKNLHSVIQQFIYFYGYSFFKRLYLKKKGNWSDAFDGLGITLLLSANPSIQFTVFDQLKNKLLTRRLATKNTVSESSPQALSASTAFLLGALSKSIATVLTYPAIRCKVMIQAAGGEEEKSTQTRKTRKTVSGVFYNIWKHEGILGYFKGLQAQILKTVISSALLLMIKEKITKSTWVLMLALRKSLFVTATKLKSA
ncbi:hypothetical protein KSS87_002337 [Heliosperma pusillum]|nr:hypothetical protein KSS87_002337 [Heliosperma pusillum]